MLDRVIKCSHSLLLPAYRQEDKFAKAGTAAHVELQEKLLNDPKMGSHPYIDFILNLKIKKNAWHIENPLKHEYNLFTLMGTPDFWGIDKNNILHVVDFKSGFQGVDPTSTQLQGYALLILLTKQRGHFVKNIKLTIVQQDDITTITLTRKTIIALANKIKESIRKAFFKTGAHCQFCPSKIHCLKLHSTITAIDTEAQDLEAIEKNKSYLTKFITDNHSFLLDKMPDKFIKRQRQVKTWMEGKEQLYSVTKAIQAGHSILEGVDWEYKSTLTYQWNKDQ